MLENMQLFGFYFLNENKIFKLNILVIIIYEMKNNGDKSLLINDVLISLIHGSRIWKIIIPYLLLPVLMREKNEMFILLGQP